MERNPSAFQDLVGFYRIGNSPLPNAGISEGCSSFITATNTPQPELWARNLSVFTLHRRSVRCPYHQLRTRHPKHEGRRTRRTLIYLHGSDCGGRLCSPSLLCP